MKHEQLIDNYRGSGEPHRVPVALGMRVLVFNHVSNDFTGIVTAINKKCVRVRCDEPIPPFTNHPEAREPREDEFLVPWYCVRVAEPPEVRR